MLLTIISIPRLIPILLILLLSSCNQPKQTPPKPIKVKQDKTPKQKTRPKLRWNNPLWDKELYQALSTNSLIKITPLDHKQFGKIDNLTNWYARILVEMAYFESNFNPKSDYLESFGLYSIGLFQLSKVDGKRYKCDFKTNYDVYKPLPNIRCAVLILSKLVNQDKRLAGKIKSKWQGGARYWAVLRGTRAFTKKALKQIKKANQ